MEELRENSAVQIRFLLGPAGTGKTFRCLEEIRAGLKRDPDGPPLLFLAPKQATFQIERQLLSDPELPGYTRLQILSFERFARFALSELAAPVPMLLAEEGRVMVLRALLAQKRSGLAVFHATARLPGFAQQLGAVFREFQQGGVTAARLRQLAERFAAQSVLGRKLADLATLFSAYREWLAGHELEDGSALLDLAADALRHAHPEPGRFPLGGVWLDGFAEMTAQELDLLAAVLPFSPRATLAFCIDHPATEEPSWLSTWSIVGQTLRRCRARLSALAGSQVETELLVREPARSRFNASPVLARIEAGWTRPLAGSSGDASGDDPAASVRIAACAHPEHEVTEAAREILRLVKVGGRFRDAAVLVRSLDGYGDLVRRVFQRYEIPFHIDRRELVTHHPLAELTRFALRTVSSHWSREDWFGALKSGLVEAGPGEIDWLENAALAKGWEGERWFQPLVHKDAALQERLEQVRLKLLPPFVALRRVVGGAPVSGVELAAALRRLWVDLRVAEQLEAWSERAVAMPGTSPALHQTVWEQMNGWLDNLALAFSHDALPLRDWLPVVEAGLGGLTAGAIPPALDQVVVGAVDRSRNPDLRLAIVLGLNESVFPAPPPKPVLLTESEREWLAREDAALGPELRRRIGHERFYGYIACTRARERLVVTYAKAGFSGEPLQPSAFIRHLAQLVPGLKPRDTPLEILPNEAMHWSELITPVLKSPVPMAAASNASLAPILEKWRISQRAPASHLSPAAVAKLYPARLPASVSALESFAACPFKFFVARGLGAEERTEFEPDARHRGSFQHELLAQFHNAVRDSRREWRDLTPADARGLVQQLGAQLALTYENGVFQRDAAARFAVVVLIENVQALVATLVTWARHYAFDPAEAELGFGVKDATLPSWELPLDSGRFLLLRGKIDRVDLWRGEGGRALAVVMDYKSRPRQLDAIKLHHGLELQLLSYLGVVRNLGALREHFGVDELNPAGVFYINLSPKRESGVSRTSEADSPYQHLGRFAGDVLALFDTRAAPEAEQFKFKKLKGGEFAKKGNEALPRDQFLMLMAQVEEQLREHGRKIFDGVMTVAPYRKGREKACDRCEYAAICRFDSWTQNYRVLRKPASEAGGEEAE